MPASSAAVAEVLDGDGVGAVLAQVANSSQHRPVQVVSAAYFDKASLLMRLRQQARAVWDKAKQALRTRCSASDYATWVESSVGLDILPARGWFVVGTPASYGLTWWRQDSCTRLAEQAVQSILGSADGWHVRFEVFGRAERQALDAALAVLSPPAVQGEPEAQDEGPTS